MKGKNGILSYSYYNIDFNNQNYKTLIEPKENTYLLNRCFQSLKTKD